MKKQLDREQAFGLARKTLQQEVKALQTLVDGLDEAFWQCALLLSECSGLVWVTGVGTSEAVGARFAHNLTCCGARSVFLSPSQGLHGHTGVMTPDDLLVAMSRGGATDEVLQMVQVAHQRDVTTIAFVHETDSPIAHACRHVLPIRSKQEFELMGYVATTSTVVYSAMCDALCAVVLEAKAYTPERFRVTHPGGAVGKALSSVEAE